MERKKQSPSGMHCNFLKFVACLASLPSLPSTRKHVPEGGSAPPAPRPDCEKSMRMSFGLHLLPDMYSGSRLGHSALTACGTPRNKLRRVFWIWCTNLALTACGTPRKKLRRV